MACRPYGLEIDGVNRPGDDDQFHSVLQSAGRGTAKLLVARGRAAETSVEPQPAATTGKNPRTNVYELKSTRRRP